MPPDQQTQDNPIGRPKVVTECYLTRLRELVSREPNQFGYPFRRWTAHWLNVQLRKEYSVAVSDRHINRLLKQMGLSTRATYITSHAHSRNNSARIVIHDLHAESREATKVDQHSLAIPNSKPDKAIDRADREDSLKKSHISTGVGDSSNERKSELQEQSKLPTTVQPSREKHPSIPQTIATDSDTTIRLKDERRETYSVLSSRGNVVSRENAVAALHYHPFCKTGSDAAEPRRALIVPSNHTS